MEMCYNDALVMPNNYVVVNEEEMTYVEGGWYYVRTQDFTSASAAAKALDISAQLTYETAAKGYMAAAILGAIIPITSIGGLLCAVGGLVFGSIMWSWGNAMDNASIQARKLSGPVTLTTEYQNFTLVLSVAPMSGGRSGGGRHM